MATYDELVATIQKPTFTARTDQQLAEEASRKYGSYYDNLALSQKQAVDKTKQTLQEQLAALLPAYARQSETAQKATQRARINADNAALSRGMNRSSYNLATMANIDNEGNRTLNDIQSALNQAQTGIQGQMSLAEQQLAEVLAQYSKSRALDEMSYIDQQKQTDYEKDLQAKQIANELALQLFQLQPKARSGGGSSSSAAATVAQPSNIDTQLQFWLEKSKPKPVTKKATTPEKTNTAKSATQRLSVAKQMVNGYR